MFVFILFDIIFKKYIWSPKDISKIFLVCIQNENIKQKNNKQKKNEKLY